MTEIWIRLSEEPCLEMLTTAELTSPLAGARRALFRVAVCWIFNHVKYNWSYDQTFLMSFIKCPILLLSVGQIMLKVTRFGELITSSWWVLVIEWQITEKCNAVSAGNFYEATYSNRYVHCTIASPFVSVLGRNRRRGQASISRERGKNPVQRNEPHRRRL